MNKLQNQPSPIQNQMKTLSLSVELSNIAFESVEQPFAQHRLLQKLEAVFAQHAGLLGKQTATRKLRKQLGGNLQLNEYEFAFEKHSVQLELAHFAPRNGWQVQGFRLRQ